MAYGEFLRILHLHKDELYRLEASVAEKLAFNARHGLTVMPQRYRAEIDRAFADELVRTWNAPSRPKPVSAPPPEPAPAPAGAGWLKRLAGR